MTKQPKRQPTFTTDNDGLPIVLVPLANGRVATVDLSDWEDLLCAGLTPQWTLNDSGNGFAYVRAQGRENLVVVARVITGAGRREIVRYCNGDHLDLRRRNLRVTSGGRAKGKAKAA